MGAGRYLTQMIRELPTASFLSTSPLLWIAEGDLLEANAIDHSRAGNMKVSGDHDVGAKPSMPILCPAGSAPHHKSLNSRQQSELLFQRKMCDEDGRMRRVCESDCFESSFAFLAACQTPLADIRIRFGMQEHLITAKPLRIRRPNPLHFRHGPHRAENYSRRGETRGARMCGPPSPCQTGKGSSGVKTSELSAERD